MTLRSRIWRAAVALFIVLNVGGAGYAVAMREPMHAATHIGLMLGAYVLWRLWPGAQRQDLARSQPADARIEYLQQSVDAIALEVERIGEAQRFSDRLRAEQAEISAPKQDQQRTS